MSFASIVIKNTARMKAVEVSSPLRFAYPKSLLSYIYICMCSAELLSKELSRENLQWRKEIHTAYKYTSIS